MHLAGPWNRGGRSGPERFHITNGRGELIAVVVQDSVYRDRVARVIAAGPELVEMVCSFIQAEGSHWPRGELLAEAEQLLAAIRNGG